MVEIKMVIDVLPKQEIEDIKVVDIKNSSVNK